MYPVKEHYLEDILAKLGKHQYHFGTAPRGEGTPAPSAVAPGLSFRTPSFPAEMARIGPA